MCRWRRWLHTRALAAVSAVFLGNLLLFHYYLSGLNNPNSTDELVCNVTLTEAASALARATTAACRARIARAACSLQRATFHPAYLHEPEQFGRRVGCFVDSAETRLLNGSALLLADANSVDECAFACLRVGFQRAGVEYGRECYCGNAEDAPPAARLPDNDSSCELYRCPANASQSCGGHFRIAVYDTGYGPRFDNRASYVPADPPPTEPVRIVFLLQLNGRDVRQVRRLIKLLYSPHHYYFVHVDVRQEYLYQDMLRLETLLAPMGNFGVKRGRHATIWGGASLLTMILESIEEISARRPAWQWDYLVNLSECDFPIAGVDELTALLSKQVSTFALCIRFLCFRYSGFNFLKSHGHSTARFLAKQGLNKVFVECENRMWRIGDRQIPRGLCVDGGSDWFALHRSLAQYAVQSPLPLVQELRHMFAHALLPAESFFHTLALNSQFCNRTINANLKLTNWRRSAGCKCQYKHIVDWCGCSPSALTVADWAKMSAEVNRRRLHYLARKVEPLVDQTVVAWAEAQAMGVARVPAAALPAFQSVWLSIYDVRAGDSLDSGAAAFAAAAAARARPPCAASVVGAEERPTVTRLHAFKRDDAAPVDLTLLFDAARAGSFEALYRRRSPPPNEPPRWPLVATVGAKFDLKERIFRDYTGALGHDSAPTARFETSGAETGAWSRVSVVWVHPNGSAVEALVEEAEAQLAVRHLVWTPPLPLAGGAWRLRLFAENASQLADTRFPVFHSTPQLANENMALLDEFYELVDVCRIDAVGKCGGISVCNESDWSSLFPDPKSDINFGFHQLLGVLS